MTRDPEWDDRQRERMLALEYYRRGVCECGFHESLTSDRSNHFTFDTKVCPVCRGTARMLRMQQQADQQAERVLGDKAPPSAPRPSDGRRLFARHMSPLEVAERSTRRGLPVAQKAVGNGNKAAKAD